MELVEAKKPIAITYTVTSKDADGKEVKKEEQIKITTKYKKYGTKDEVMQEIGSDEGLVNLANSVAKRYSDSRVRSIRQNKDESREDFIARAVKAREEFSLSSLAGNDLTAKAKAEFADTLQAELTSGKETFTRDEILAMLAKANS